MTTQLATARRTQRRDTGRYLPRRFNPVTRGRFLRDRRRRYLARLAGSPTERQVAQIDAMTRLEWQALSAEAIGSLQADREAREFRRLLDRLLSDFERSVAVPEKIDPLEVIRARLAQSAAERGRAA